ncbi:MAG: hypothetical protein ACI4WS_08130 [Oscillospiraceae bacterium]
MKRRSFFAIAVAMALLSGCASGSVSDNSGVPAETAGESSLVSEPAERTAGAESKPAGTAASGTTAATRGEVTVTSAPEVTASDGGDVTPDVPPEAPDGDTSAGTAPATSAATAPPTTTVPVATAPPTTTVPAATETPKTHSDPTGADYKPTDIGGSGSFDGDYGLEESAAEDIVYAEADMAVDDAVFDMAAAGGYYEECCPIPSPEPPYIEPQIPPQAGLLTGGEWKDNDNWDFWQSLYGSENYSVDWESCRGEWRTGADFRLAVTVKDSAGNAVSGAKVVTDEPKYSAVTDNHGKAYLFYSQGSVINGFTELTVTFGDITASEKLTLGGDDSVEITLDREAQKPAKTLDFMIMCDTTGSMWDELDYLKEELEDVVTRIKQENANIPTRLSVNFYRDEGDEYVVREFPFTTDLDAAVNAIAAQSADGGGDTPEAVHTALNSAINSHDWDEDSIKIMFLVLDAPPHSDIQIIDETVKLVKQAAEKGIRIIPVASSGVDKSTEYLLRSMAFMTGGTYTFLTDDSGIGGSHIEPTIGSYDVEKLNDMMVRITGEYLS